MGDKKLSIMSLSLPWAAFMVESQSMPSFIKSATFFRIARSKSVTMFMVAVVFIWPSLDLTAMDQTSVPDSHST